MSSSRSLEEVVRNCQRTLPEDTRDFEQLVAFHKRQVFGTAYRVMGNRQDAEDQAQEVFLKVYRNIRQIKEPSTFSTWLYQTTVNTCLDALRRTKRKSPTISLDEDDESANPHDELLADLRGSSPCDEVEMDEIRECIEQSFAQLEDTERAILVMREVDDCAYEEIAQILGLGLSAVKMRIHRARLAMQRVLQKVCPDLL